MKIKCDCGSETFTIEERITCDECVNNPCVGCYRRQEFVQCKNKETAECEDFKKNSSENRWCEMGMNYDNGCMIVLCSVCKKVKRFIPWSK